MDTNLFIYRDSDDMSQFLTPKKSDNNTKTQGMFKIFFFFLITYLMSCTKFSMYLIWQIAIKTRFFALFNLAKNFKFGVDLLAFRKDLPF